MERSFSEKVRRGSGELSGEKGSQLLDQNTESQKVMYLGEKIIPSDTCGVHTRDRKLLLFVFNQGVLTQDFSYLELVT